MGELELQGDLLSMRRYEVRSVYTGHRIYVTCASKEAAAIIARARWRSFGIRVLAVVAVPA